MPTTDLADDASQEATDMLTFLIAARDLACGLRDRETSKQLADCIERIAVSWDLGEPSAWLEDLQPDVLH